MEKNEYMRAALFDELERRELGETYIFDSKCSGQYCDEQITKGLAAVIIHLYYEELLPFCLGHIMEIPKMLDVYIAVTSEHMAEQVKAALKALGNADCKIIVKNNRGRDVSTLLVACREKALTYRYICFIHDKRYYDVSLKEDTELWLRSLWDNMLKSKAYIFQLINLFEKNPQLGLAMPPKFYGRKLDYAFGNIWGGNYDTTVSLAKALKIKYPIEPDSKMASISTVFWCRTDALEKILGRNWQYEDFPEEPLGIDGAVSHALERLFSYAATDKGYDICTVMNTEYAASQYETMNKVMAVSFDVLRKFFNINRVDRLIGFQNNLPVYQRYAEQKEKLYIYGAGEKGRICSFLLQKYRHKIQGYIVSEGQKAGCGRLDFPAYELNEVLPLTEGCGIFLALKEEYREEVIPILQRAGIDDYCIMD